MAETEMVERVAKAICDELNGDHGCGGFCVAVAKYGAAARAAIEAMREPTEAMVGAADSKVRPDSDNLGFRQERLKGRLRGSSRVVERRALPEALPERGDLNIAACREGDFRCGALPGQDLAPATVGVVRDLAAIGRSRAREAQRGIGMRGDAAADVTAVHSATPVSARAASSPARTSHRACLETPTSIPSASSCR